jgi:Tol biopolymer transport system component
MRITETGDISLPACLSWARNGYLTFRTSARHTFRLWVVRSNGSDRRELAFGLCGTLSPAGDRMVYMNGDLWLVSLDGSNPRPLTSGRNFLPGIWSPDGTRILSVGYSSEQPDDRDLYVIDPANGRMQQLTEDLPVDALPAWSPDGQFIAFSAKRDGRSGIYVIRADGAGLARIPTPEEAAMPRWASR